ncbi:MAG: hypothetical protein IPQ07_40755 [Myxococcales bacterium]|nr:hypothetical protein [Myxococcales bacterium]
MLTEAPHLEAVRRLDCDRVAIGVDCDVDQCVRSAELSKRTAGPQVEHHAAIRLDRDQGEPAPRRDPDGGVGRERPAQQHAPVREPDHDELVDRRPLHHERRRGPVENNGSRGHPARQGQLASDPRWGANLCLVRGHPAAASHRHHQTRIGDRQGAELRAVLDQRARRLRGPDRRSSAQRRSHELSAGRVGHRGGGADAGPVDAEPVEGPSGDDPHLIGEPRDRARPHHGEPATRSGGNIHDLGLIEHEQAPAAARELEAVRGQRRRALHRRCRTRSVKM